MVPEVYATSAGDAGSADTGSSTGGDDASTSNGNGETTKYNKNVLKVSLSEPHGDESAADEDGHYLSQQELSPHRHRPSDCSF